MRANVSSLGSLFAALAVTPSLLEPEGVPATWRYALRAVGVPMLVERADLAIHAGVSVITLAPWAAWTIEVERQDELYVARVIRRRRSLAA